MIVVLYVHLIEPCAQLPVLRGSWKTGLLITTSAANNPREALTRVCPEARPGASLISGSHGVRRRFPGALQVLRHSRRPVLATRSSGMWKDAAISTSRAASAHWRRGTVILA